MIVVKFGGSSLADAEKIRAAARIVAAHQAREPVACVVSAVAGVTNALLRVARATDAPSLDAVLAQHQRLLRQVSLPEAYAVRAAELATAGERMLSHLRALSPASWMDDEASAHGREVFSAWGERLAIRLFAAALEVEGIAPAPVDAAPVVTIAPGQPLDTLSPCELDAMIHHTRRRLDKLLARLPGGRVAILPGYLARTLRGRLTTLGRNGSDCSAALVGAALRARAVILYSDVRGVFRADPHLVPEASLLPRLSYEQALRVARTGAAVVHAGCVVTVARAGIPLLLRSASEPNYPGTRIGAQAGTSAGGILILSRSARATGVAPTRDAQPSTLTILSLAPAGEGLGESLVETARRALAGIRGVCIGPGMDAGNVTVRAPSDMITAVARALHAACYKEVGCLTP